MSKHVTNNDNYMTVAIDSNGLLEICIFRPIIADSKITDYQGLSTIVAEKTVGLGIIKSIVSSGIINITVIACDTPEISLLLIGEGINCNRGIVAEGVH